jgi:small subunit ribosomal protein S9
VVKEKITIASGKRKTSIARATLRKGKGRVRVNSTLLDNFQPKLARLKIQEPLILAGDVVKKIDIKINVKGGGIMSQAEAARNAVAKGLVEYTKSKDLKKKFLDYDRHLLVADVRRTEPQKPYRSAARAMRQTSKR